MVVQIDGKLIPLKPSGWLHRGRCPACESSPSLGVNTREETVTAHCFMCGKDFTDVVVVSE